MWTEVARHSASIFQQVHDEEQNKVTLGQVRETLRLVHKDLSELMSISKFKKKLSRKKKLDQMVDHDRFWQFVVKELGVENDEQIALSRMEAQRDDEQYAEDSDSSSSSDDGIQRADTAQSTELNQGQKKSVTHKHRSAQKDDFKRRKLTNFDRSARVFSLMEDQNGLWITMRQIHVYLKWLTEKLQTVQLDWSEYVISQERIDEETFKRVILQAAMGNEKGTLRKSVVDAGIRTPPLETAIELGDEMADTNDVDGGNAFGGAGDEKYDDDEHAYSSKNEENISAMELARLKRSWKGGDDKLFSEQLSWIFSRCALTDVATDQLSSWQNICKFMQGFRDGSIEMRIRHDLKFLTGNHQVYRDEFEQFKATLKCRADSAISLFTQIRKFSNSINWSQIAEFLEFIETNMVNVEDAIDKEPMGEDEDPTVEELIPLMKIPSEVDGNWLFSTVIKRNSDKVSWVEIREYLIDWNEARDEVTEYFEELIEKRDREKLTEKTLDDITSKLGKIKTYFDDNTSASKDELNKKTKEELVEYIAKSQWHYAAKHAFKAGQSGALSMMGDQSPRNMDSIALGSPMGRPSNKPRHSGKLIGSVSKN